MYENGLTQVLMCFLYIYLYLLTHSDQRKVNVTLGSTQVLISKQFNVFALLYLHQHCSSVSVIIDEIKHSESAKLNFKHCTKQYAGLVDFGRFFHNKELKTVPKITFLIIINT